MVTETSRKRATQQRAEETKEALIRTGIELFSSLGYEGVSIRALEEASNIKRGLVAYHFNNKETLWKAVAERMFSNLPGLSDETVDVLKGLDQETYLRAQLTAFVQYSARHPELSRFIIHEGKRRSWRLEYIVDNFVRPRVSWISEQLGEIDAHTLYIFIGAATLVFDVEAECEALFGFNPRDDDFVQEHANRLCDMLLASGMLTLQREN